MEINSKMIENGNEAVKDDIIYFKKRVNEDIEKLSKNSLKRLLKVYSGFSFANEILGSKPIELTDEENKLLTQALTLQENCLGYSALKDEIKKEKQNG